MASRCGYPVQEEDPTPNQPLLLPVTPVYGRVDLHDDGLPWRFHPYVSSRQVGIRNVSMCCRCGNLASDQRIFISKVQSYKNVIMFQLLYIIGSGHLPNKVYDKSGNVFILFILLANYARVNHQRMTQKISIANEANISYS